MLEDIIDWMSNATIKGLNITYQLMLQSPQQMISTLSKL